jgi:hypothetical protein
MNLQAEHEALSEEYESGEYQRFPEGLIPPAGFDN